MSATNHPISYARMMSDSKVVARFSPDFCACHDVMFVRIGSEFDFKSWAHSSALPACACPTCSEHLRVDPKSWDSGAKSWVGQSKHDADHCETDERRGGSRVALEVAGEAPIVAIQASVRSTI
jgi:hypothetical protein